jgi:deoxyribonuclease-1
MLRRTDKETRIVKKSLVLMLLFAVALCAKGLERPKNLSQAKNVIKVIHFDYQVTWLNGCRYRYDIATCMSDTILDEKSCKLEETGQKMVWLQVVPSSFYGRNRACMNEPVCKKYNGTPFGGPRCCRKRDAAYRLMQADLFNLIPVASTVAQRRTEQLFFETGKGAEKIGEVRISADAIEPPDGKKGDIARICLYMNDRYGIGLSEAQQLLYYRWHKNDPVDAAECAIEKHVAKIQGVGNPWIRSDCDTPSSSLLKSSAR